MAGTDRTGDPITSAGAAAHVRLVYHYADGHDFTTESMLEDEALAYMPVLLAQPLDARHYAASFATIELQAV